MSTATLDDVALSLRRELAKVERDYVPRLLDRVEAIILARLPEAAKRAGQDEAYRLLLATVEADAVARVLRSPNNGVYKTETEGNYTYHLNLQVASGLLGVLDDEWERLGATVGVSVVMPGTDLYLQSRPRRLARPDLSFQCDWPGEGYPSSEWVGWSR